MCLCVARACRHHLSRVHPYKKRKSPPIPRWLVSIQSEPDCSSPSYLPTCRRYVVCGYRVVFSSFPRAQCCAWEDKEISSSELTGRTEKHPPFMPDPGHGLSGVSWVGHLRICNSHGGSASGRASEACGCPFAGRDRHGDPLHTDQCFWRLLLALCAIATPEAVLGEWVAMLLRQWIEPLRAPSVGELRWRAGRFMHSSRASCRKRVFRPPVSSSLPEW